MWAAAPVSEGGQARVLGTRLLGSTGSSGTWKRAQHVPAGAYLLTGCVSVAQTMMLPKLTAERKEIKKKKKKGAGW